VVGFRQFGEKPVHFVLLERHVDLDGGMTGDGGGDASTNLLQVQRLLFARDLVEQFVEHVFDSGCVNSGGRDFDGDAPRAETDNNAATTEYLVEPGREQLIPLVIRTYIEAAIFHALVEAEASFFGAQMTSMDNATNNASEMIQSLTLEMNRARQAMITRELMDIVGGAEALKGQAS